MRKFMVDCLFGACLVVAFGRSASVMASDAEKPVAESATTASVAAQNPTAVAEQSPTAVAEPNPTSVVSASPSPDSAPPRGTGMAEFNQQYAAWKELLGKIRTVQENYQIADRSKQPPLAQQFTELLKEGHAMAPKLVAAAEKAYAENPHDTKLIEFLGTVAMDGMRIDDFETSYRISKLLVTNGLNDPTLYNVLGVAAFCVNQYDDAKTYLDLAAAKKALNDKGKEYAELSKEYEKLWPAEAALRAAEAKADDLPRVKLTTTKGDIVVELFENEAPNSTANFISLVEKGFYDNTPFHRVLQNFMAQGGDPTGTGKGNPGYAIACECYRPDARKHFRGSLSMAHAGRDTGGSQFFLTFTPTSHLNGMHTVFGRVIEGMDVLSKLQRLDPEHPGGQEPDHIVKAVVLRKRDHAYVPVKVGG